MLTREQAIAIKRNLEAQLPALRELVKQAEHTLSANLGVLQFITDLLTQGEDTDAKV